MFRSLAVDVDSHSMFYGMLFVKAWPLAVWMYMSERLGWQWVPISGRLCSCTLSRIAPREHRSHVLSAFSVQEQGLRLLGKGLFPFWDYIVRLCFEQTQYYNTTLFRYRIHMGVCTLFCFFGTCALLWERTFLHTSTKSNHSVPSTELTIQLSLFKREPPQPLHVNHDNIMTTPARPSSSLEVDLVSPPP